jgi:hypothetical protein
MIYARVSQDGSVLKFPITEDELRAALPNVVLPPKIVPSDLDGTGYVCVPIRSIGEIPRQTKDKMVVLSNVVRDEDGKYSRVYSLYDVPEYAQAQRLRSRWTDVRGERARRMAAAEWRYHRWNREMRLGLPPTDDIKKLDTYMQALADITKLDDPFLIEWPTLE